MNITDFPFLVEILFAVSTIVFIVTLYAVLPAFKVNKEIKNILHKLRLFGRKFRSNKADKEKITYIQKQNKNIANIKFFTSNSEHTLS